MTPVGVLETTSLIGGWRIKKINSPYNITGGVCFVMAMMLARGAGMFARRYAPNLFNYARRAYVRNPALFRKQVYRGMGTAAAAGGGIYESIKKYGQMTPRKKNIARYNDAKKVAYSGSSSKMDTTPIRPYRSSRSAGKAPFGLTGKYKGKFKKGTRKAKAKQSMSKYTSTGSLIIRETVGTVQDPDCVYLYAHVFSPEDMIQNIARAIARKICEKSFKCKYASEDDLVLGGNRSPTLGNYLWVVTYVEHGDGTINTQTGTINNSTTLTGVATAIQLLLQNYSSGYGFTDSANDREPFTITVYKQLASNTDSVLLYTMNLCDEYCDMMCTTEIKVQNRSLSSQGLASTDLVDTNPIQGYVYEFSSIPKSRDMARLGTSTTGDQPEGTKFASITYLDGMNLVRGAEFNSTGYKEPVLSKQFYNCSGVGRVRLEPGDIKKRSIAFQKTANVVKFLQDMNQQRDTNVASTSRVIKALGGGVMFAFEDVINVNSSNLISLTYEVERRCGCYLKTRKSTVITPTYFTNTYNNAPPA